MSRRQLESHSRTHSPVWSSRNFPVKQIHNTFEFSLPSTIKHKLETPSEQILRERQE